MKALVALVLCTPLLAAELEGNKIVLTPAEVEGCWTGCYLLNDRDLAIIEAALDKLRTELRKQEQTCRRGEGLRL